MKNQKRMTSRHQKKANQQLKEASQRLKRTNQRLKRASQKLKRTNQRLKRASQRPLNREHGRKHFNESAKGMPTMDTVTIACFPCRKSRLLKWKNLHRFGNVI